MKKNIYTIKRLCEELNQPRQKVRRRLLKLKIEATNENTRLHTNIPLEYDYKAFTMLAKEFKISASHTDRTASEQLYSTHQDEYTTENKRRNTHDLSKDKLINVLEEQLKESNKSRENLERLLDQQQRLTLMSNRELEVLKLEIEESNKSKKNRWYDIFKEKMQRKE